MTQIGRLSVHMWTLGGEVLFLLSICGSWEGRCCFYSVRTGVNGGTVCAAQGVAQIMYEQNI